ncbi:unnamed protein product [Heligmosomoides polygyrus]|uniref:Chromo domain-containing protein n=1 Tax=Heligmosomoides polygyrus TaxID=6339 RepID=A0A183FEW2_HELPZ|nr:unnamed protein product [Heligmosomoides polygyrus]
MKLGREQPSRYQAARLELGTTKPGRRKVDKQTWLGMDDVKAKVREKKSLYHVFLGDRTADNWQDYQKAKKAEKKAVAVAKSTHYGDITERSSRAMLSGICNDLQRPAIAKPRILKSSLASMMRAAIFWQTAKRR